MKRIGSAFGLVVTSILAVVAAVFFLAARADWSKLNCRTWPDAGNCSDAVSVQLIAGSAFFVVVLTHLILWRLMR